LSCGFLNSIRGIAVTIRTWKYNDGCTHHEPYLW